MGGRAFYIASNEALIWFGNSKYKEIAFFFNVKKKFSKKGRHDPNSIEGMALTVLKTWPSKLNSFFSVFQFPIIFTMANSKIKIHISKLN